VKFYDLTPLIHSGLGVFPGDRKFSRIETLAFSKGQHLDLSSIESTLHLGAHADSTSHYSSEGLGIEQKSLRPYLGLCQVIRVKAQRSSRLSFSDLASEIKAPRVLIDTQTFPEPDHWNSDFAALDPELIHSLAKQNVLLVGLDTPSVDLEDSKELPAHQALLRTSMSVLEGLVLKHVPEGLYNLIALPLPIQGADASPVRAILIPADSSSFFAHLAAGQELESVAAEKSSN
jgi:arylformamidase